MREAIGGSWLFAIVMVFIVLFASFLAISINYSRAFSVKNEIINYIEDNQGFKETAISNANCGDRSTECQIFQYLKRTGYNITDSIKCPDEYKDRYGRATYTRPGGYCLKKVCSSRGELGNAGSGYYSVTTYVRIELPLIWKSFNVPITGQTMTLYYDGYDFPCSN